MVIESKAIIFAVLSLCVYVLAVSTANTGHEPDLYGKEMLHRMKRSYKESCGFDGGCKESKCWRETGDGEQCWTIDKDTGGVGECKHPMECGCWKCASGKTLSDKKYLYTGHFAFIYQAKQ